MDAAQKERILEEDYGLAMEQELEKELKQMCNLSEAIEEKALEKGLKKGIKQGFSRGKAQGIAKGKTQGISQGIRLTKRVLRLAGEGLSESDIAAAVQSQCVRCMKFWLINLRNSYTAQKADNFQPSFICKRQGQKYVFSAGPASFIK